VFGMLIKKKGVIREIGKTTQITHIAFDCVTLHITTTKGVLVHQVISLDFE